MLYAYIQFTKRTLKMASISIDDALILPLGHAYNLFQIAAHIYVGMMNITHFHKNIHTRVNG